MKRILLILCVVAMILELTACTVTEEGVSESAGGSIENENIYVFTFSDGTVREMTMDGFLGLAFLDENTGRNRDEFREIIEQGVKIQGKGKVYSAKCQFNKYSGIGTVKGVYVKIRLFGGTVLYGVANFSCESIGDLPVESDLDINLDVYENDVVEFEGTIDSEVYFRHAKDTDWESIVCMGEIENRPIPIEKWDIMDHFPNVKITPSETSGPVISANLSYPFHLANNQNINKVQGQSKKVLDFIDAYQNQ